MVNYTFFKEETEFTLMLDWSSTWGEFHFL